MAANTDYDDIMHGGRPYESLEKPKMRQGLRAAPVPARQPEAYRVSIGGDHQNPTYEDIMHDGEKSFESSQKPEIRQGLPAASVPAGPIPAGPAPTGPIPAGAVQVGPVQAGPVPEASELQADAEVLLKRYLAAMKRNNAAVIVLYVLCALLLLAIITILFLFVGHTRNSQTIHNHLQDIPGDDSMTSAGVINTPTTTTRIQRIPKDCQGYKDRGVTMSGVYPIQMTSRPDTAVVINVYCDMLSDGGGWTTLLKREDGRVPFQNLSWSYYKSGFGDVSREHWIGNDFMNELTLNNGDLYELRFDLEAFDGEKRYAKYQHFAVANEEANYRLFLGSYSGDAGDDFEYHANMEFTTVDRDNDKSSSYNCAVKYTGGWWYNGCDRVKLTGTYGSTDGSEGVNWDKFKGSTESLKYADMKVRPSSIVKNSCKALKESGVRMTGPQNISMHLNASAPTNILVLCDQVTEGGRWMLILKRIDGETVDFNRNWAEYQAGFGQQQGEFWFGLETLHKITSTVVIYELYIGLKTSSNDTRFNIYTSFKVTAESDDYRLVLGPVKEGDLVDSLRGNNGRPFSTRDVDNDNWEQNCAQTNAAGWWYNSCTEALLTGRDDPGVPVQQRLHWKNWLGTGEEFPPIAEATMMIRPVD